MGGADRRGSARGGAGVADEGRGRPRGVEGVTAPFRTQILLALATLAPLRFRCPPRAPAARPSSPAARRAHPPQNLRPLRPSRPCGFCSSPTGVYPRQSTRRAWSHAAREAISASL